jgi:hypothetical protein
MNSSSNLTLTSTPTKTNVSYTQSLLTFDTNNVENLGSQSGGVFFVLFIVGFAAINIWQIVHKKRPFLACYPFCCCPVKVGCFGIFQGPAGDGAFCAPAWSNIAPVDIPTAELMRPLQDNGRYMPEYDNRRDPRYMPRREADYDARNMPRRDDDYDARNIPRGEPVYDARNMP